MNQTVACDKCDKPNDIADRSNYCSECRDAYQRRVASNYETRPVGAKWPAEETTR